jgi:hypothetical protein
MRKAMHMNRTPRIAFELVTMILAVTIAGCSNSPDELRDRVQVSLANAESQRLDRVFPDLCASAQDSFDAALEEIAGQDKSLPVSRSYDRAEQLLHFADSTLKIVADSLAVLEAYYSGCIDSLKSSAEAAMKEAVEITEAADEVAQSDPAYAGLRETLRRARMKLAQANTQLKSGLVVDAGLTYEEVDDACRQTVEKMESIR